MDCINCLQADVTEEQLLSDETISGPTIHFRVLRDYLVQKHSNYQNDPNTSYLLLGIAHCFLHKENREYAFSRLATLRDNVIDHLLGTQFHALITRRQYKKIGDRKKLAYNILEWFKNDEKFSVKLGEHILDFLNNYEEACLGYEISKE